MLMNTTKKRSGLASGFTLLELLTVVVIFAVLAMLAFPSIVSVVPGFQLRQSARTLSSFMYLARMNAVNTQKPIRASVDCRPRSVNEPCRLQMYSAVFNSSGELIEWKEMPGGIRLLGSNISVNMNASSVPYSGYNTDNLYWAIFMPTGKVISSQQPFNVALKADGVSFDPYEIALNRNTGHVTLTRDN